MTDYKISEDELTHITSHRARGPITVDGDLGKPAWKDVPRSPRFVDMVSGEPAIYDTRVACQWDETHFYVGYWAEEPYVTVSDARVKWIALRRSQVSGSGFQGHP